MAEASVKVRAPAPIAVSRRDLPLSCPNANTVVASLPPRVYISLKQIGDHAICPYCGAEYVLKD